METTPKEFYEVRLYLVGIKKKERKVKRHGLKLVARPLTASEDETVKEQVQTEARYKAVTEMRELSPQKARIIFTYTEDLQNDVIRSSPFDDRNFELEVEL